MSSNGLVDVATSFNFLASILRETPPYLSSELVASRVFSPKQPGREQEPGGSAGGAAGGGTLLRGEGAGKGCEGQGTGSSSARSAHGGGERRPGLRG